MPGTSSKPPSDDINFYVELQNVTNFKRDTRTLRSMLKYHVLPVEDDKLINLVTYYKPLKLSSKFSTRTGPEDLEKNSVVYQFDCPEPSCNEVYIGYTNQKLLTRVQQHRRKASPIFQHYVDTHNDAPPPIVAFKESFSILYMCGDLSTVKIAEAIFIKNDNPVINTKYNELYDFLKLY